MRWKFWSGRRDRLALSLLGTIVLAVGLSFMSLLSDSVTGTVTRTYEQTWRAPYDILVHMPLPDSPNIPDLSEPNVLTTLPPGISKEQLEVVESVPGVSVAAPLATVGYVSIGPRFIFPAGKDQVLIDPSKPRLEELDPGVYRFTNTAQSHVSATAETVTDRWVVGLRNSKGGPPGWLPAGSWVIDSEHWSSLGAAAPTLMVGVDPTAEDLLTGLSRAMKDGRYFEPSDGTLVTEDEEPYQGQVLRSTQFTLPVLINDQAFDGLTFTTSAEMLDQQFQATKTVYRRTFTGQEILAAFRETEKQPFPPQFPLLGWSGQLAYRNSTSPFAERWPAAVSLKPIDSAEVNRFFNRESDLTPGSEDAAELGPTFRQWTPSSQDPREPGLRRIEFTVLGTFEASRLSVVKNPDSQLPLMTYRPAEAAQALDASGRPVNPPRVVSGGLTPTGFLSSPPVLLTTLDAALKINGDRAINAIQVKVQGSEHFTPEDVAQVRQVADEIRKRTGLVAEVVMGSSPMNVLVHVPASNGHPDLGWFQEQWIHKNAAVTTVQQAEFGYSAFIAMVLLVALLYAVATGLAGVAARRRELGVVAALGWSAKALRSSAVAEQLLFALAAGLLAAVAAAYGRAAPWTVGITFLAGLLVYLPAVMAAGHVAARVSPGDALRWGDTAPGKRVLAGIGVMPLAASSLMGRPGRTVLTVGAIALPTALMLVLAFISRHLSGVLYTTVAGQYTALKVGPLQYVAGVVGLAIAAVTAFDLVRQNAIDHRDERGLLSALGWPRNWIARTMVTEGMLLGMAAGLFGDLLGLAVLALLYGPAVAAAWQMALVIWLLPLGLGILTGSLSALAELRSWNRAALAGVGSGQVIRWSRGTVLASVAAALLVVLAAGYPVMRQVSARMRAQAATARASAEAVGAAQIKQAVTDQSQALQKLDFPAFLATLDPSPEAAGYRMEQEHWLEDAQVWRSAHPQGHITRDVLKMSFLGDNTAVVRIFQSAQGSDSPQDQDHVSMALDTIWVQGPDGRWSEHGLQHEVLIQGDVTVWYSGGVPQADAQESAKNMQQAVDRFRKTLGWNVELPVTLEMMGDPKLMRATIGPHLAGKQGIPPWAEYGEPLRVAEVGSLTLNSAYYDLAYKSVMDQSRNHAAEWLREALARDVLRRLAGVSLDQAVAELRASGPMTLDELPQFKGFLDMPAPDYRRAAATAELFAAFLEQRYGSKVTVEILAELAKQPVDPSMTGPATYDERSQASIEAIEKVTGRSWQQLNGDYQAWFRLLP